MDQFDDRAFYEVPDDEDDAGSVARRRGPRRRGRFPPDDWEPTDEEYDDYVLLNADEPAHVGGSTPSIHANEADTPPEGDDEPWHPSTS